MEDNDGAHALPIDETAALQQGMEGGDAAIYQGAEAGDAGIGHGVEGAAGMEDGDDGALQGDQDHGVEADDALLEEAVEDDQGQALEAGEDDAGLEDDMEHEDGDDVEADDALLEEAVEDDQGHGMEAGEGDAGLEDEDADDVALQDMDALLEEAMEGDDADADADAMEGEGNAGLEDAMEDEDADMDAGVDQAMEDDDAAAAVIDIDQFIEQMGGGVTLLPHNHVLPLSIPGYEASPDHLLLQWSEFKRSGPLESIVLLADRDEEDGYGEGPPDTVGPLFRNGDYRAIDTVLPAWTLDLIREAFNARTHATIEVLLLDGRRMQLDFLRKICVQVDEDGTPLRSIAMYWVDDEYRVFTSARIFGMDEESVRQRFHEACRGRLVITAVRRCFHSLHGMNPFCERIEVQRPVFGWYGAEADLVKYLAFEDETMHANWHRVEMMGFERPHGHGVHIAPMRRIMKSAMLSMVGAFHQECQMLLCALAPGFKEVVPEGSEQDSPSNPLFQSRVGLDRQGDLWYLFWETSDPGGVLPLYLVSFVYGH